MEIGSLFFALGFKSKGTSELNQFESATEAVHQTTIDLMEAFDGMIYLMEKMAVKIGAITQGELDLHKADLKLLQDNKNRLKATTALSIQDVKSNENINKSRTFLGNMHQALVKGVGALNAYRIELVGATTALTYFVKKASDMAVEIDKLSAFTGIPTQKMEQLGAMAAQAGSNIEDVAGAIQHLQQQSLAIRMGQSTNIGPYMFLGLDPHSDPIKMLDVLQKKMNTMPRSLWMKSVKDLGLSDSLIYFIMNAGKLEPPAKETILSDKEIGRLKEFNFYFNRVFDQSKRLLSKLGATIAPFATGMLYAFDRVGRMIGSAVDFLEKYEKQVDAVLVAFSIAAVIAGIALFPEIVGLGVAFTALLAVIEDIYTYTKGGKSWTGFLIKEFSDLEGVITNVVAALNALMYAGAAIWAKFTGGDIKKVEKTFGDLSENMAKGLFSFSGITPTAPTGAKNNSAITNNTVFNVDGSKSPKETAEAIAQKMKSITGNAYYQQPLQGH